MKEEIGKGEEQRQELEQVWEQLRILMKQEREQNEENLRSSIRFVVRFARTYFFLKYDQTCLYNKTCSLRRQLHGMEQQLLDNKDEQRRMVNSKEDEEQEVLVKISKLAKEQQELLVRQTLFLKH